MVDSAGDAQRGLVLEKQPIDAEQTAQAIESLIPNLDAIGIEGDALDGLRESARLFRGGDTGINAERVEAEYQKALRQIEQLELLITNNSDFESSVLEPLVHQSGVPEAAADYYRQLSEQPLRLQR